MGALPEQMQMWPDKQEDFWNAVVAKDSRFDGRFVVAVSSTGIYCRPSCPARRPRRENVSFYPTPEAAEEAGYRACLRCHPKKVSTDPQVTLVRKACRYLESQEEGKVTLAELSEHVGVSPFHLQRTFKHVMGITPRQYAALFRMEKFKTNVRQGESVTSALYGAGFGSSSRLYERTDANLGMTPATYSRGGQGVTINYTVAECSLGQLLVAATERGICSVKIGSSDDSLQRDLLSEYPAASIERNDPVLKQPVNEVLAYLEGKQSRLDLPLDLRATAFQLQVWENLRTIPYGETRSYSEIAKQMGQPKATRAVARACATNPVALVIPCHRVIREDKSLGGYRWGLNRKKKLLEVEEEVANRSFGG
jgi:AraC family transcriptional regulator of adaptative response/methylated-DNA-[protein]-cysteine methyltransferase